MTDEFPNRVEFHITDDTDPWDLAKALESAGYATDFQGKGHDTIYDVEVHEWDIERDDDD